MKEKNKGFTLIELLAVIVILALIALIATPIILNVINDAKKQAAKDSFHENGKAVEKDDKKDEETIDVYKDGTKVGVTNDLKKCNIGTTNCYIGYTYGDKKGTAKLNLVIGYDANVIGSHDMEASDFYTIVGLNSSSCNYSCFTNPNASFCETSTCTKDNVIPTGYEWLYNFDYCNDL